MSEATANIGKSKLELTREHKENRSLPPTTILANLKMPRKADIMLASDHAETQQGGVLDGIEQYELPRSAVVRVAKTAVRL